MCVCIGTTGEIRGVQGARRRIALAREGNREYNPSTLLGADAETAAAGCLAILKILKLHTLFHYTSRHPFDQPSRVYICACMYVCARMCYCLLPLPPPLSFISFFLSLYFFCLCHSLSHLYASSWSFDVTCKTIEVIGGERRRRRILVCFVDICEFDNARLIGSIEPTTITLHYPMGPIYLSG